GVSLSRVRARRVSVEAAGKAVLGFAANADDARTGLAGRDDADTIAGAAGHAGPANRGRDVWLILDPAWTPTDADVARRLIPLREVAARVLAREDLFPTTTRLLDDWADASGIVGALTVEGTSFWYRRRLWAWRWLQERLIWIEILDEIARDRPFAAVEPPGPDEPALGDVVRLIARRDGLELLTPTDRAAGTGSTASAVFVAVDDEEPQPDVPLPSVGEDRAGAGRRHPLNRLARELVRRSKLRPADRRRARIATRRAAADARLDRFAAE